VKLRTIGRPQHRVDGVAGAAADLAGQDQRAGLRAEIGFEHVLGDLSLDVRVGKNRQPFADGTQLRDLLFRETTRPVGGVARHVAAVGAGYRKAEIFSAALRFDVVENGKIEPCLRSIQTAVHGFAAVAYARHQVFFIGHDVHDFVHHHDFLSLRRVPPPHISGTEELRMQRAAVQRDPQHRKAGGVEPPGIFVEGLRCRRDLPGRADQPGRNSLERVVARPLGRRTFVHARREDALTLAQSWRPDPVGAGRGFRFRSLSRFLFLRSLRF